MTAPGTPAVQGRTTAIHPERARRIVQDCLDLLAEITGEIVALQTLVCRPGAWGQLGAPVAAGVEKWKQQLLQTFVQLVGYLRELNDLVRQGANGIQKADDHHRGRLLDIPLHPRTIA